MSAPSAAAPRRGPGLWLFGLGCGALVTLATPVAVLAALLLAPCGVALVLDTAPGRPTARPVLLAGLAGGLHPLLTLWGGGDGIAGSLAAADLPTIAIAWAAQGAAWLAAELAPFAVTLAQFARSRIEAARLRAERAALEQEWGLPPPPG